MTNVIAKKKKRRQHTVIILEEKELLCEEASNEECLEASDERDKATNMEEAKAIKPIMI